PLSGTKGRLALFSPHCAPEILPAAQSLWTTVERRSRKFVPEGFFTSPRQSRRAGLPWLPKLRGSSRPTLLHPSFFAKLFRGAGVDRRAQIFPHLFGIGDVLIQLFRSRRKHLGVL